MRTIVVLPDGTELSSGTTNAIKRMSLTQCVNEAQELMLGSACAAMLELTVISEDGRFSVKQGDELRLYRDDGVPHLLGVFVSEQPTRASAHCLKLTAYDRVIRLDRDLTDWLAGLGEWPYRLDTFAHMVCHACAVELRNTAIPNGDYLVQRFAAQGITGRQLMKWVGQLAGCFCRATAEGKLELAWYTPSPVQVGINRGGEVTASYDGSGALRLTGQGMTVRRSGGSLSLSQPGITVAAQAQKAILTLPDGQQLGYYQNSLSFADYQVAPIEKVQLKATADDVGTVYPADLSEAVNTYVITDNPLLTAQQGDALVSVARTLYEQLSALSYTPCKLTVPADARLHVGDILTVTDRNGVTFQTLVMTRRQSGQRDTLECTGSARRDSSAAVNSQSYQALSGKVMELKLDVDGLRLQNQETQGKLASLSLTVDGVESSVREQLDPLRQSVTELTQQADALHLSVQSLQTEGAGRVVTETGFTFDADGLHIQKNESDMENLLDETGMYVRRGGQTILQANDDGVEAVDVTVKNYLIVGSHARFEDYRDGTDDRRTACYWL